MDFTVAIRTYNEASRLPRILDRIREQVNIENIAWEIVLVDNNSTDDTAKIVQQYQSNWPTAYPIRYYLETQQGAVFARQRAIQEAKGDLIGFLDDDNFPSNNWVSAAFTFGKEHPKAVAYGSRIRGKFETEPPKGFERIQSFLAIKERGEKANLYDPDKLSLPAGAGLVIRKKAWLENVPETMILQGPVGKLLTRKGEDFEALLHLARAGEIWYNPEMCIDHEIPTWRLERDYLIGLVRSVGLTICQLRMINAKTWEKPMIMVRIILGNLRRAILLVIEHRGKLKDDLVTACEMEFYLSSLISPFYVIKNCLLSSTSYLEIKI